MLKFLFPQNINRVYKKFVDVIHDDTHIHLKNKSQNLERSFQSKADIFSTQNVFIGLNREKEKNLQP